jgi:hypothetical protein
LEKASTIIKRAGKKLLGVRLSAETAGRISAYMSCHGLVKEVDGCLMLTAAFMVEILLLMQLGSGLILIDKSFHTSALEAAKRALLGLINLE